MSQKYPVLLLLCMMLFLTSDISAENFSRHNSLVGQSFPSFAICIHPNVLMTKNKVGDANVRYDGLFKSAHSFLKANKIRAFKTKLHLIEQSALLSKDTSSLARVYKNLAFYFLNTKERDSSYYYFLKAIKFYDKLKDDSNLMNCHYKLATIQLDICDNWNAQLSTIRSYKYAKKIGDLGGQQKSLMLMAIILNDVGDYERAIEKNYEALKLISESKDTLQYTETCISNLGGVYQNLNKDKVAISYFEQALQNRSLKFQYPILYARLLTNLAYSNIKLKKFKNVERDLRRALIIGERHSDPDFIVNVYNLLSKYYLAISDSSSAIFYGRKGLRIAQKNGNATSKMNSLILASKYDRVNCGFYIEAFIKISDSLQLAERKNQNKFARIAFETDEITIEKDQAVKQKWIVTSVAATLILFGLLLFIVKMHHAKQKELILLYDQQKSDEATYQLIHNQQIKIDEGRYAEKKRISLELHDGVMNKLTSTRLNLFILNKKQDDETIKKCLTFIDDIQDIEREIRKVAHDLSDDIFSGNESFNLVLRSLFESHQTISSATIYPEVDKSINWEVIDNSVKMNLYRILQEILQNCNKYAEANSIFVTVSKEPQGVFTHTHDDGRGFNLNKPIKGIGLKNIAQRVQTLNGKLAIYSQPGEGTTISFFLPTE